MDKLLKHILFKIEKSTTQKGHPFAYGSLASTYNNIPNQRMVVLRDFENNTLKIYTDLRSKKVTHFSINPKTSLLLFDNEQMEQVILKGSIEIEKYNIKKIWASIPKHAHRDYTSVFSPGEPIDDEIAKYSDAEHHFCILKFSFSEIDYLKIDKPYNSRAVFKLDNQNEWKGTYVVP